MADQKDIKHQRDRFLAFSFASADLFLEIAKDNTVTYALGAAKSISGIDDQKLIGHSWPDLFAKEFRKKLAPFIRKARPGERCRPIHVRMDDELGAGREAIVTGIKMPESDHFYMTLGFISDLMVKLAHLDDEDKEEDEELLKDKEHFITQAKEVIDAARTAGEDVDMTLIEMGDVQHIKERMSEDEWEQFVGDVGELLTINSYDGEAAAEIGDGRYSVIHDTDIKSDDIKDQLSALAKKKDPVGEGIEVLGKTITADIQNLSEREATKALVYTLNEFERKGADVSIENLNSGFKAYVNANAHKIQEFKTIVENMDFDLHFQPIVEMDTHISEHYEMLTRFRDGGSTQEWIIFGEDIGMAADFDIAVCERAINYIMYKSAGHRTKFAVNMSGQSIQNEQFFKALMAKLSLSQELPERLIFEVTESTAITNLELVNNFLQKMRQKGFKVCLDDFGAGSASFQYIQALDVDYVKVDGEYTDRIMTSNRDEVMVKNLVNMCHDLKMEVIAEKIETEEQAEKLREIGVHFGQGYLYGKPEPQPSYVGPDPEELVRQKKRR